MVSSGLRRCSGPRPPRRPRRVRSYVKPVEAAVFHWRAIRGTRTVFDLGWSPRMGVSWSGIKRSCVQASLGKCPPLLSDVRAVCTRNESSLARLRQAARAADLPSVGVGLGPLVEEAMVLRSAESLSVAFFGARRASEVAALRVSGFSVSEFANDVGISVRRQRDDQFGIGQLAHLVAPPSWKGACNVRRKPGWLLLRGWLSAHRGRSARMSDPGNHAPLFVGLARARFGLGTAASGLSVAWIKSFEGLVLSPWRGATRSYIMNGMTREAAQDTGGWTSPAVVEAVCNNTRTEEVLPEMRSVVTKACAVVDVASFVEDGRTDSFEVCPDSVVRGEVASSVVDWDVCPDSYEVLGPDGGARARARYHRFCFLEEYLVPLAPLPIRDNFWSSMGRRVRLLNLSDSRRRVVLC